MANEQQPATDAVVSDPGERLFLVDDQDRPYGYATKSECHEREGLLHRAFSLFVINGTGQVLMQQRSANKLLWPLYWSNSCCSHPREGESMAVATERRLMEELGIACDFDLLFKFRYQASFGDVGSENEYCWVYLGRSDERVVYNRNEIASWCFIEPEIIDRFVDENPHWFTPWFILEWRRIVTDHWYRVEALTAGPHRNSHARVPG